MRWASMRVPVTGGAGFLGAVLVDTLRARGCRDIAIPRSREYDANRGNPGRFF
jgi:GDP-L-fucose synthase